MTDHEEMLLDQILINIRDLQSDVSEIKGTLAERRGAWRASMSFVTALAAIVGGAVSLLGQVVWGRL